MPSVDTLYTGLALYNILTANKNVSITFNSDTADITVTVLDYALHANKTPGIRVDNISVSTKTVYRLLVTGYSANSDVQAVLWVSPDTSSQNMLSPETRLATGTSGSKTVDWLSSDLTSCFAGVLIRGATLGDQFTISSLEVRTVDGDYIDPFQVVKTQVTFEEVQITSDLTVNGNMTITGETVIEQLNLNGTMTFSSDTTFHGHTIFSTDAFLDVYGRTLFHNVVTSDLVLDGDVVIDGTLTANSDVTLNGLSVVNGLLDINSDTTIGGSLTVSGHVLLSSDLAVTGHVSLNSDAVVGRLVVSDTTTLHGTVTMSSFSVNSDTTLSAALTVVGHVLLSSDAVIQELQVSDTATITGLTVTTLTVNGYTIHNSDTTIMGTFYVNGNTELYSDLYIRGQIVASDAMTISGHVSFNSDLAVRELTSGLLTVNSDTTMDANLTVAGHVSLNSDAVIGSLVVSDITFLYGTTTTRELTVNSDATIHAALTIDGHVLVSSDLSVTGHVSLNSDVVVGQLTVTDTSTLYGTVTTGALTVNSDTTLSGGLSITGHVVITSDAIVQQLLVSDLLAALGVFTVAGNAFLNSDLSVPGTINTSDLLVGAITSNVNINSNTLIVNSDTSLHGLFRLTPNVITSPASITSVCGSYITGSLTTPAGSDENIAVTTSTDLCGGGAIVLANLGGAYAGAGHPVLTSASVTSADHITFRIWNSGGAALDNTVAISYLIIN